MRENDAEVEAWTEGLVKSLVIYCHKPVGFEGEAEGFADSEVASDERIEGKERLLAEDRRCLREPVVLVSFEHIVGCLHTAADGCADVWVELADLPECVYERTCPEDFVVAAALDVVLQWHCGEISFEAGTDVLGELDLGYAAETECAAFGAEFVRVVAAEEVAAVDHHSAAESLDDWCLAVVEAWCCRCGRGRGGRICLGHCEGRTEGGEYHSCKCFLHKDGKFNPF